MVESAIIFPCLVLILWWSAAVTDVMVLKLKAAEAARYALWQSTVFQTPSQIDADVQQRFVDMRSPASLNLSSTGMMMYPLASNIDWKVLMSTNARVNMGGKVQLPGIPGIIGGAVNLVLGWITSSVDGAMRRERFNVWGKAQVRVRLQRATHDESASMILKGGDLLGLKGGNDLDHDKSMTNLTFDAPLPSEKPMSIVFDTWKAWPKPAAYTTDGAPTNTGVSPMQTYPEVEKQVSAQVKNIAYFGLTRMSWFDKLNTLASDIAGSGVSQTLLGGRLADVFSSERMDGPRRGPITILPVERPDLGAPNLCDRPGGGQQTCWQSRIGDVANTGSGATMLPDLETMGDGVDRTRYTVPYRINSVYWKESGGTDRDALDARIAAVKPALSQQNEYVKTYRCRGHYFAGATTAGQTTPASRYKKPGCYQ